MLVKPLCTADASFIAPPCNAFNEWLMRMITNPCSDHIVLMCEHDAVGDRNGDDAVEDDKDGDNQDDAMTRDSRSD